MNQQSFSGQKRKAYYYNSIDAFVEEDSRVVLSELINASFEIGNEQRDAWKNQISELQSRLKNNGIAGDIIFEYDIIRLGKRIDVILLIRHMVFSLEFKNGKTIFSAQDARQAEDYAIDIKNFHKESEDLYVCPILIATDAPKYEKTQSIECYDDKQIYLQRENMDTVIPKVCDIVKKYGSDTQLDFKKWFNSPYHPTPTIISAAIQAYQSHDLSEIARSEAGQEDISNCEKKINEIIEYAKLNKKKCICFVTGVPGAGKTLVGLNAVSTGLKKTENSHDNLSVYISGNGPLVEVLREALVKSVKDTENRSGTAKYEKGITEAAISTLIQSSYFFKNDNVSKTEPTPEHVLIFDEAQRVWDKNKMVSKHKDASMSFSEPQLLMSIMNRHKDWAVMVCLVGLGQDIYDGEVGINEWFRTSIEDFKDWEIYYSSEIFKQTQDRSINKQLIDSCTRCRVIDELHLKTSVRSFRADKQCKFVDCLLDNKPDEAKNFYNLIKDKYPVF